MSDEQKGFVCPECGRTFLRAQALGVHRSKMHGVKGGQHPGPVLELSDPPLQRPLDEEKLSAYAAAWSLPNDFNDQLKAFLPILAQETRDRFRRGDHTFVDPFLTLYLDQPVD